MNRLPDSLEANPKANSDAVVQGNKFRFTILTSRLIRIEYDEDGCFNDQATFMAVNRKFAVPEFFIEHHDNNLIIETEHIRLLYHKDKPFSQSSLNLFYKGDERSIYAGRYLPAWRYGITMPTNLKGTTVALDNVDGECELEEGIMSCGEICVLDDSHSRIFDYNNNLIPQTRAYIDQYLFCYGLADGQYDYQTALYDYYTLSGKTPMLPRYALGNWWSRYYAYTQDEYKSLIQRFKKEQIPFTVAMLDMDWHYTNIDKKYGGGWTGYTWNEQLFPNHCAFLQDLHLAGYHVGLNLHPQGGIAAHEQGYKEMAYAMKVDADKEEIVEFDVENPEFLKNQFAIMYDRLEQEGVSFWWIDYNTSLRELDPDPLPLLNYYHYTNNCKDGLRGMILSRYAGPGSHRYPVGFSGDTVSSWKSLAFQPYFTANASNIGYCWWSNDIGGFQKGKKDDELMARWVQYGVFSPILRLHSAKYRYFSKEPWRFDYECERSMKKFLRLRHALIPYLYSMNYRLSEFGVPLIRPLYYEYGEKEAYMNRTEYLFGSEMIVSPIVKPHDHSTGLGSAEVYLPSGDWYDFFTGKRYKGGKTFAAYRDLQTMPVFVKSGGIIPMQENASYNDINNPLVLNIKVFAGAANSFELYEDDGISLEYKKGKYAITKMNFEWGNTAVFSISTEGERQIIPKQRLYIIEFIGITPCNIEVNCPNGKCKYEASYSHNVLTVKISAGLPDYSISLKDVALANNDNQEWLDSFLWNAVIEHELKDKLYDNLTLEEDINRKVNYLEQNVYDRDLRLALLEIISGDI